MTNETKIGLLVGLAFIIVVGILLSPSGLPQMPDASLTAVGNDVRTGTATLHNNSTQNEIVPPPAPPTPSKPVLTHDELREETKIIVTPGGPPVETQTGDHRQTPDRQLSQNSNGSNGASNTSTHSGPADTNEGISPELEQAARQHNVELQRLSQNTPPVVPSPPTVDGVQQYVAESGDTVSKLAGRYMGGNTKANREAIIALNPSLKQNPNNIIVGRRYAIPSAKTATAAGAARPAPARPVVVVPAPVSTPGPQYFYTVKENDNLWKIAANQLGDGTAWATIKELNKDVLKGGEAVKPNMRLRLPAKPVASIQ